MWQLSKVVPIHEDILLATVAVQITVQNDLSFFLELADQTFYTGVFGVQNFRRIFPSSVEILTDETAAIVAVNNAVRIQHRNYLKYKAVPQHPCLRCLRGQKVDNALHGPR